MKESVLLILSFALLAFTACSSDDDKDNDTAADCEQIAANDPAGSACGDGCPSVDCTCEDGSSTSISSCFNGACEGAASCPASCEDSGGWVCDNLDSNNENNANNANNGGMFDCDGDTCDSATQFCLITTSGSITATRDCVTIPDGCSGCDDCMYDSARAQFPTSNNCSGVMGCSSSGSQVTIGCQVP